MPECSTCSPGLCTAPDTAPAWCFTGPFDPEGIVSSFNAIITTVIGIHYGHILRRVLDPNARVFQWVFLGVMQLAVGLTMHFSGFRMNTNLYSLPFVLVTGGTGGLVLAGCYCLVDRAKRLPYLWRPFMFLGMNAITMYILAEGGIIQWLLQGFYWDDPDKNLSNILWPTGLYWGQDDNLRPTDGPTYDYRIMLWCLGYIGVMMMVAWEMFRRHVVIRI